MTVGSAGGGAAAGRRSWDASRWRGAAADFHARPIPDPLVRTAWWFAVDRPALVLGSAQPWADVDGAAAARSGVDVVRRRSGGGAVLLTPGDAVWVDLLLPAGDPLWRADIGLATHWVGELWASVLRRLAPGAGSVGGTGVGDEVSRASAIEQAGAGLAEAVGMGGADGFDVRVHTGGMVRTPWSPRACFAGLGPGEVTIGGRKVVGISQRRARAGARFQTVLLLRSRAAELADLVGLGPEGAAEVDRFAVGLTELGGPGGGGGPVEADAESVWTLLLDELDRR